MPGQHLADELADPPIAGNDDAPGFVRWRLDLEDGIERLALREAAAEFPAEAGEKRNCDHREGGDDEQVLADAGGHEAARHGATDDHQGELAGRSQQQPAFGRFARGEPEGLCEERHDHRLGGDHRGRGGEDQNRRVEQAEQIEIHPHRHEEDAEQQPLEGLDRHVDRAAIFGFRQEDAGDEGAQRHRQAADGGDQAGDDDHEQAGGHEHFRALGRGGELEEGAQDEPPDADQNGERDGGLQHRPEEGGRRHLGLAGIQHREREQDRRDREILEDQRREGRPPGRRFEALLLGHDGDHDRGRGKREGEPDDRRAGDRSDETVGEGAQRGAAEQHLQRTESENQASQGPQALPGELDADGEQQEHDAEFGKVRRPRLPRESQPVERTRRRPSAVRVRRLPSNAPAPRNPSTGLILNR